MSAANLTGHGMDSAAVLSGVLALYRGAPISAGILRQACVRNTRDA